MYTQIGVSFRAVSALCSQLSGVLRAWWLWIQPQSSITAPLHSSPVWLSCSHCHGSRLTSCPPSNSCLQGAGHISSHSVLVSAFGRVAVMMAFLVPRDDDDYDESSLDTAVNKDHCHSWADGPHDTDTGDGGADTSADLPYRVYSPTASKEAACHLVQRHYLWTLLWKTVGF